MKRKSLTVIGIVFGLILSGQCAVAAERILSFDSIIQVNRDGSMRVTELIRVRAEGRQIKRGIYRDFPTRYKDRHGANYVVDFKVLAVNRDGRSEAYFTKPIKNGIRIYIGRKDHHIDHGEYTYALTYRTNRQLGFFDRHHELYWNVTGNGWSFPIDSASATVILPTGVPMDAVSHEGYTGPQGAKDRDYDSRIGDDGRVVFETTRPLKPREGLTIVAMWPKGFVQEPDLATRGRWFFDDNAALLTGGGGVLFIMTFYLLAWRAVGRDPDKGVVFPHYEPPKGFSPASMRFIKNMSYDPKTFATALVNLAVKGYVNIKEKDSTYTIERKNGANGDLAPGEAVLLNKLLIGNSQKLDNEDHAHIRKAIKAHEKSLRNDYERIYFNSNLGAFIVGGVVSALVFFAVILQVAESFLGAWIGVFALGMLGFSLGKGMLDLRTRLPMVAASTNAVIGHVVVLIAIFGVIAGLGFAYVFMQALVEDPWSRMGIIMLSTALLAINGAFYQLMKAPTLTGRKLLDRVDGFEEYLKVAEEEDLKLKNPPKKTPELFEKYLPYAMALDVEAPWGDKFAAILDAARRERAYSEPSWYHGSHWHSSRGPAGFATAVASSLAVSAAAAASPPGSSGGSGGGGGGSSGGGGGGGGGGGW